jgi:hypothetical protein
MSEDLLVPRVMKVLLSQSVAKMDFWAHGMHISAGGYVMVWFYIAQRRIKVRLVRLASQIPKEAAAQYIANDHSVVSPGYLRVETRRAGNYPT